MNALINGYSMDEREQVSKDHLTGVEEENGPAASGGRCESVENRNGRAGQQRGRDAPSGETIVTRRSFLAAVGGAASAAAVPAARAASGSGYGEGEYGAGTYGGV